MKKTVSAIVLFLVCTAVFSQSFDTFRLFLGGGGLYNNHSAETFDGVSYYSGSSESFIAPLWSDAPGFYAVAGMAGGDSMTGFQMRNSIEYRLAVHNGTHTEGVYTGYFNEVILSAAFSFLELAGILSPYLSLGLTWSWLYVENGVLLSDSSSAAASYPGMAAHVGGGIILDFDFFEIDAGAGYRIMDYLSGTYDGFSAHFGGIANGWYAKAGINLVFYD